MTQKHIHDIIWTQQTNVCERIDCRLIYRQQGGKNMGRINTETETVIKKILPYLKRRGYDVEQDFDFETAVSVSDRYTKGFIDILVTLGKKKPLFLIEAKRIGKNLTQKDRDQAISYGCSKEIDAPFVVVTNGKDIQCYNVKNKQRIIWDGKRSDKIPSRDQIEKVVRMLRKNPDEIIINISNDESLPFRQGLPLRQLNALFAKGHNTKKMKITHLQTFQNCYFLSCWKKKTI